jgi:hypothetical protein
MLSLAFREYWRIIKRAPLVALLGVMLPVFVISCIITPVRDAKDAPLTYEGNFASLVSDISTIQAEQDLALRLRVPYNKFIEDTQLFFSEPNIGMLMHLFTNAKISFDVFMEVYEELEGGSFQMILVSPRDAAALTDGIEILSEHFYESPMMLQTKHESFFTSMRGDLGLVWDKTGIRIQAVLNKATTAFLDADQISRLMNQVIPDINQAISSFEETEAGGTARHTSFMTVAESYLLLSIKKMQAENHGGRISIFYGFEDFRDGRADAEIKRLGFLLDNLKCELDYASALNFWGVMSATTGTTIIDYIFTNMEIVSVLLILLGLLLAWYSIFVDIKNNTIIGNVASMHGRGKTIISKLIAISIIILTVMAMFVGLFYIAGSIFASTNATLPVLTMFNGNVYVVSPLLMFVMYLVSLFLKVLFFAFIMSIFCVGLVKAKQVLLCGLGLTASVIVLNALLGRFAFWAYSPLAAVDFIRYVGVNLMLSSPACFAIAIIPVLIAAATVLVSGLFFSIRLFCRRDFW